ncbi:hypothetical protein M2G93_16985 [Vibrio vulnificus]|uniref:hypothetical protein n=1 Tax=Vibrio vulnificus TaxID=672 RepID=UPI0021DB6762|nr:hypothetical protein [Vibrio vulnificus]MCU8149812.1 hypothetical protein [Vibrio vulnificus]MCU8385869.1 hypothetical protein [Vibrio vulnificus]
MIVVRHRYHYGSLTVSPNGLLYQTALVGSRIPALLRNGDWTYKEYKGAFDDVELRSLQQVKLINLIGYTFEEDGIGGWIDIPPNSFVLGAYFRGGFYLLLKDGKPQIFSLD